jgi:hypothetical protein
MAPVIESRFSWFWFTAGKLKIFPVEEGCDYYLLIMNDFPLLGFCNPSKSLMSTSLLLPIDYIFITCLERLPLLPLNFPETFSGDNLSLKGWKNPCSVRGVANSLRFPAL